MFQFLAGLALGLVLAANTCIISWCIGYDTAIKRIRRSLLDGYVPCDAPLVRRDDDEAHGDVPTIDSSWGGR